VSPARWLRDRPAEDKLLAVDVATGARVDAHVRDLPSFLRAGDVVVVNDAATLPASLEVRRGDERFELRLASRLRASSGWAVAFGAGSWRTPTEQRARPPELRPGDALTVVRTEVALRVTEAVRGRLVRISWESTDEAVLCAVYAEGRPIQYSHVDRDLPLWAVQTPLASRPWAVEMPSAGRSIGPAIVSDLRNIGVLVHRLTHAAGLSSTGDPRLDAMLPLEEDYEIPEETAAAVNAAHDRGGRVIAVGTTVVRALESAGASGRVEAGAGSATLKLDAQYRRRIVDGIVTGFHERGSSHLRLLAAFAPETLLASTYEHAETTGYLCHELGDVNLIVGATRAEEAATRPLALRA
jgi:S-adenosylmethionine:tRNA ribosyltransferase-isomerase